MSIIQYFIEFENKTNKSVKNFDEKNYFGFL